METKELVHLYDYSPDSSRATVRLKVTARRWRSYDVAFPSAHPTPYAEANTVRGEYYQPLGIESAPLVILVHGMGDQSAIPCRLLARSLAARKIAAFVLYLMFHSSRMPQAVKERFPALTPEEWLESYRLSVVDIRQVADWASHHMDMSRSGFATFGISFGGFVSAIAMGIDRRITAGVFAVSAGNSTKITHLSKPGTYGNGYRLSNEEYDRVQESYVRYLAGIAERGIENVVPDNPAFLTDPMTYAGKLRGRPLLMMNALWDKYIPREAVEDFWRACGTPAIRWFPSGHASIWLWYPVISRRITRFLKSTLAAPGNSRAGKWSG